MNYALRKELEWMNKEEKVEKEDRKRETSERRSEMG